MGKSFRFDPLEDEDETLTKADKKRLKQERKDRRRRGDRLDELNTPDDD